MWLNALAETTAAATALTQLPLMSKGLLTTLVGLLGVFLVLFLFFVTIKLLQRVGAKKDAQ